MSTISSLFRSDDASRDVFLHEDDYCLVELLPAANWWWCLEEMSRIEEFAVQHEARGGGWTNVQVSNIRPMPLADLHLDVNELIRELHTRLPIFDRVVEGYVDHRQAVTDTVALGFSSEGALFVEFDLSGVVTAAWLSPHPKTFHETAELTSILADLSKRFDLVLADWQWNHLINPTEPRALSNWMDSRRTAFWGNSQLSLWAQDSR